MYRHFEPRTVQTGAEVSGHIGTSVELSFLVSRHFGPRTGHFGPKTFRHHPTGAEVSWQFGTSAVMSRWHFGTGTELSRPPANICCYNSHTEERFTVILLVIIKEDHW